MSVVCIYSYLFSFSFLYLFQVRNPLAAAMSACSFVSAAVHEKEPFRKPEELASVREDLGIIKSSLAFVNDLLRSMLDIHRAESKQMKIENSPTGLLADVLQPVSAILYNRNQAFNVEIDCPDHLFVNTDRIRLKQIVLNLANNSRKFVQKGFIRLRATVLDGNNVRLHVEDSGPGIPKEKQKALFVKYQDSLDSLSQGTGIGLSLCKNLIDLLGGELWLDTDYNSEIEDCPGACFVIDLKTPPLKLDTKALDELEQTIRDESIPSLSLSRQSSSLNSSLTSNVSPCGSPVSVLSSQGNNGQEECGLPEKLAVLFVDDDPILRKLFSRSVVRAAPTWSVREASSGEAALQMVAVDEFDLIFVDQYMASTEKQMLGTETVRALRSVGSRACICGLSANDVEKAFLEAGASAFMMKPFPCETNALQVELTRVVLSGGETEGTGSEEPGSEETES